MCCCNREKGDGIKCLCRGEKVEVKGFAESKQTILYQLVIFIEDYVEIQVKSLVSEESGEGLASHPR